MAEEETCWLAEVILHQFQFAGVWGVGSVNFDKWSVCQSLVEAKLVAIYQSRNRLTKWFERYLIHVHLVVESSKPNKLIFCSTDLGSYLNSTTNFIIHVNITCPGTHHSRQEGLPLPMVTLLWCFLVLFVLGYLTLRDSA